MFDFLLINIDNTNTEKEQVSVFNKLIQYYVILKISIIIMLYLEVALMSLLKIC